MMQERGHICDLPHVIGQVKYKHQKSTTIRQQRKQYLKKKHAKQSLETVFAIFISAIFQLLFDYCLSKVQFLECCVLAVCAWFFKQKKENIASALAFWHVVFFSNNVCVTVCAWCFVGVANDCLNGYMREFEKVSGPRGKWQNSD